MNSPPTNLERGARDTIRQIDSFRLEGCVAESAMASVYRATDLRDGRQVAIKVPHRSAETDPALAERFRREEEIGAGLDHPNVMRTFPNPARSCLYMVMEWVPGALLRRILSERGKLSQEQAIRITVGILDALEYIHSRGIVHRDLKPENIMVDENDQVKLIDFGIASKHGAKRLTYSGISPAMGTPDYISPEQVRGKRGDQRSDLYALGVMLYEMLTGRTPFSGPTPLAVMNERLVGHPLPPRKADPSITPQLQEILYRALEREPKNRYPTAHEFKLDLTHLDRVGVAERPEISGWRPRNSRRFPTVAVYLLLALIPLLLFAAMMLLAHSPQAMGK